MYDMLWKRCQQNLWLRKHQEKEPDMGMCIAVLHRVMHGVECLHNLFGILLQGRFSPYSPVHGILKAFNFHLLPVRSRNSVRCSPNAGKALGEVLSLPEPQPLPCRVASIFAKLLP